MLIVVELSALSRNTSERVLQTFNFCRDKFCGFSFAIFNYFLTFFLLLNLFWGHEMVTRKMFSVMESFASYHRI